MDLPSIFMVESIDDGLMRFFLRVVNICQQVNRAPKQAKNAVNLLKWTLRIVNKYLFKYVHPEKTSDSYFSTDWIHLHAYNLWDSLLGIVKNYREVPLDSKIMALVQKTIFNLLAFESITESKMERADDGEVKAFFHGMISCLYLTPSEQRYFEENPGDFIKNNDETIQHEVSLFRYYTIKILKKVTKMERFQVSFLKCCSEILFKTQELRHDDLQTSFIKEMAYSSLQICSDWLLEPAYRTSIVDLVNLFICPELETDLMTFLLVRILLFLGTIAPDSINEIQADKIFSLVNKHLKSQDCTIRLAVLTLIQRLLNFTNLRSQFGQEDVELLVDLVLETILQSENEILIITLKQILDQFHGMINTMYPRAMEKLCEIFFRLTDHISSLAVDDSDSKELEERSEVCLAARNCLMLLEDIIKDKLQLDQLDLCRPLVLSLLKRCYERHEDDLLSDGNEGLSGIYMLNALVSRNQLREEDTCGFASILVYSVIEKPISSTSTTETTMNSCGWRDILDILPSPLDVGSK